MKQMMKNIDMEIGYYLALIDVLKLNDKIKADLLYSKSLSEKECKIIEKYNEELKQKLKELKKWQTQKKKEQ